MLRLTDRTAIFNPSGKNRIIYEQSLGEQIQEAKPSIEKAFSLAWFACEIETTLRSSSYDRVPGPKLRLFVSLAPAQGRVYVTLGCIKLISSAALADVRSITTEHEQCGESGDHQKEKNQVSAADLPPSPIPHTRNSRFNIGLR